MKRFFLIMMILALFTGCSAGSDQPVEATSRNYVAACFSAGGFSPGEWESTAKDFFQGEGYVLYLDAEQEQQITVYEYPTVAEAAEDLACLDENGYSYSRACEEANCDCADFVMIEWAGPPHFYLYENLILEYIGEQWKVLCVLESNFGPQKAGVVLPQEEICDMLPIVMIDDKLYYSTGLINRDFLGDNVDGSIEFSVENYEIPKVNGESNFGAPYIYRYGQYGDTVEVCIDGEWTVFEHRSGDGSQVLVDGVWQDMPEESTYDNWGLHFGMRFLSADGFEMVFDHNPEKMTETGELTTSPEYMVRVIRNGEAAIYMERDFAWDSVLYTIAQGGETVLEENFQYTYGTLPPDQYVLCKPVQLTTPDGEVLTKIYTARFAVTE